VFLIYINDLIECCGLYSLLGSLCLLLMLKFYRYYLYYQTTIITIHYFGYQAFSLPGPVNSLPAANQLIGPWPICSLMAFSLPGNFVSWNFRFNLQEDLNCCYHGQNCIQGRSNLRLRIDTLYANIIVFIISFSVRKSFRFSE